MVRFVWTALVLAVIAGRAGGQEMMFSGQEFMGAGSVGSNEPLFPYDDQDPWKHGYLHIVPFYGGYHSGRPYNYHHVFAQTQTSVGWGMPHGMPYSQQWWTKFEPMGDPGRAQTEPNGYYGHAAPPARSYEWTAAPPARGAFPHEIHSAGAAGIAPVQYQPVPGPTYHPVIHAPGVDPRLAPIQTQQLQQYLAAPGAY